MSSRTAFDSTATLTGTPDEVWRTLTDWSLAPRWMPGVQQLRASTTAVAPGTTLTFVVRGKERTARVHEAEAPHSLVLVSRSGPVTATYRYRLAPAADRRTALTLVADVMVTGPLALLAPVIRRAIAREDAAQPRRLAALLEATAAT